MNGVARRYASRYRLPTRAPPRYSAVKRAIRHTRTPDPGAHLSDDSMHTQPAELGTERESVMEEAYQHRSRHHKLDKPTVAWALPIRPTMAWALPIRP